MARLHARDTRTARLPDRHSHREKILTGDTRAAPVQRDTSLLKISCHINDYVHQTVAVKNG